MLIFLLIYTSPLKFQSHKPRKSCQDAGKFIKSCVSKSAIG